jgi:hypothetical protein
LEEETRIALIEKCREAYNVNISTALFNMREIEVLEVTLCEFGA